MLATSFTTKGGIRVHCLQTELNPTVALDEVYSAIDSHQGAILSSGFDYPGRHSRWDIGFVRPALEFIVRGNSFEWNALHEQGKAILPSIQRALDGHPHVVTVDLTDRQVKGTIKPRPKLFAEETRSRQPSIFSVLRAVIQHFQGDSPAAEFFGLYGAFGYDLVLQFENIREKFERSGQNKDCHLYLPLDLRVIDRKKETAYRFQYSIETPVGETKDLSDRSQSFVIAPGQGERAVTCDHDAGEFASKVQKVVEGTKRGDYFEVVLSQTFSTRFDSTPTKLFNRLAELNPSPYLFLVNLGEEQLIGSSPEIYIRVVGRRFETCPIAGTIARGRDALEDADRVRELITSHKDESELTMCTDVDRNDMARVCVPGSVRIIGRRQLEFYSHLIHTVDHVEGVLAPDFDALDAFATHMWACTVTGAPKPAALQEIEDLEKSPRGWYSAAIGYISFDGNINTGITIRAAELKDGRATIRAGATLLFGSDPETEEVETRTKAAAFLSAITALNDETVRKGPVEKVAVKNIGVTKKKILLIDFHDSFVHNLAAYLRELGCNVVTYRPGFPEKVLNEIAPDLVLLSPGPAAPKDFQMSALIEMLLSHNLPIFGVCLGHQGIGEYFGATLSQLPIPQHGKTALVEHNSNALFDGLPKQFEVGRYHSLYLVEDTIPDCLEVIAKSDAKSVPDESNSIVMAIRHRTLPIAGVQFHPESLMTLKGEVGKKLLQNILRQIARN